MYLKHKQSISNYCVQNSAKNLISLIKKIFNALGVFTPLPSFQVRTQTALLKELGA
jgi:hypothetical protein